MRGSVRGSVRSGSKAGARVQQISDFDSESQGSIVGMTDNEMNELNENIQELEKQQLVDLKELAEFDSLKLKEGKYVHEKFVHEFMQSFHKQNQQKLGLHGSKTKFKKPKDARNELLLTQRIKVYQSKALIDCDIFLYHGMVFIFKV